MLGKQPVNLVDFHEYRPREECVCYHDDMLKLVMDLQMFTEEEAEFFTKVRVKSGLARNGTFLPNTIHPLLCDIQNPETDLKAAFGECQEVVCGAVEGLLHKTGLAPKDVDILISTCSIYCPTPSMASMVVNRFKMRPDIQCYHLSGMGCSNGVGALKLVHDILQARPNSNAILVTTETVTPAYYRGRDKHRMVANLLFRMGAAAMLMSNKAHAWPDAKYRLDYIHRVHIGASDDAYGYVDPWDASAIQYGPDEDGHNGIYLGLNVVTEASRGLTKAMRAVGPHVLTLRQKAEYAANWAKRALMGPVAAPQYTPSFNKGVQHFLLHAGGAKVLDGLGKALHLNEHDLEPSRAVLYDYGNISSSTTWYTLGYIETVRGVKAGDRVMQVGVGSGIKCAVAVWKALRDVHEPHEAWEHRLPEEQAMAARVARSRPAIHVHMPRIWWVTVLLRVLLLLVLLALHVLVMARIGVPMAWNMPTVPMVDWAKLRAFMGKRD